MVQFFVSKKYQDTREGGEANPTSATASPEPLSIDNNNDDEDVVDNIAEQAICILSHFPFFNLFKTLLEELHSIFISNMFNIDGTPPLERFLQYLISEVPVPGRGECLHLSLRESVMFTQHAFNQRYPRGG